MGGQWYRYEIVFLQCASTLYKKQGVLVCRSLLHGEFHTSAESIMPHLMNFGDLWYNFSKFW